MKTTLKTIEAVILMAMSIMPALAQERNCIYSVKVNDLEYAVPKQKQSAGAVIGTVLGALAGESSNSENAHRAPAVSAMVRTAFSDVRRLASVTDGAEAQFELKGAITSIVCHTSSHTHEYKDSKGKVRKELVNSYEASIGVTLILTDLASGQQWTNSFSANTSWYEDPASEADAFEKALRKLGGNVAKTYNRMFPLVAYIVEAGEVKKDKQKDVYIDLGQANGIYKGLHFEVSEVITIADRESRKRIGRLKVEETMGDDISRCKVEKGAKEIKTAIEEGKTLLVVSVD